MFRSAAQLAFLLAASSAFAQARGPVANPFPAPIEATAGIVSVNFTEFAVIPDAAGGEAPRMMHLVDEPGTKRMFVSTMRGAIYSVSYDGKTVTEYVDVNAPAWKLGVQAQGSERGCRASRSTRNSASAALAASESFIPTSTHPT